MGDQATVDRSKAITLTHAELSGALKRWESDAEANGWNARTDDDRFDDTADYLLHIISLGQNDGLPKDKDA